MDSNDLQSPTKQYPGHPPNKSFIHGIVVGIAAAIFCSLCLYASVVSPSAPGNHKKIISETGSPRIELSKDSNKGEDKSKEKVYLPYSIDEIKDLYEEVVGYKAFLNSMTWLLPISLFLLVSLGATLASHFVESKVFKAKEELVDRVKKEVAETQQKKLNQLERELTWALASGQRSLAIYYWRSKSFNNAISLCDQALHRTNNLLSSIMADQQLSEGTKQKNKAIYSAYQTKIMGELAYYYTDLYLKDQVKKNADSALKLARQLYVRLEGLQDDNSLIAQIDNYIYVACSTSLYLSKEDKKKWERLYSEYRDELPIYLAREEESGKQKLALYEAFYAQLGGGGGTLSS